MRLLLDTNILLDLLLKRQPWLTEAEALVRAGAAGQIDTCLSALSIANLFYIGRRQIGTERARVAIRDVLDVFEIIAVDRAVLEQAHALPGSDFEDNIQIACARSGRVDAIVTRDPRGFSGSGLPVWAPADLLSHLK